MPKNKLTDYSATNASNTDVGGVNIDEGMLPSDVNNAIREVMTHLKEFEDGTNGITKLSAADAEITGTGAIKVPVGTTAQRPTPATGQLRFNSTDSSFEGYDGSAWGAIGGGAENSFTVFEYTATASQTTFSGADDNAATLAYTADNIQVILNGVVLDPSDYTATNGTSVVLASGAALNDVLNIYAFTSFSVADTVSASTGGTFSANVAVTGDLTVDTNTLYVDSTSNYVGIATSSPENELDVRGTVEIGNGSTQRMYLQGTGTDFRFYDRANLAERLRIGSTGIIYVNGDGTGGRISGDGSGGLVLQDGNGRQSFVIDSPASGSSQAMTLDANNRLGIGTTSPTSVLHLKPDSDSSSGGLALESENGTHKWTVDANNAGNFRIYKGITAIARFDSSGNFLVGVTENPAGSDTGIGLLSNGNFNQTKGSNMMNLYRGGVGSVVTFRQGTIGGSFSSVGTISVTGSATSYNTSSDYRLKENVTADWDATTRVKQLNPVRFNFIAEPDTTVDGFLAHEVQDIVPEAITGTKDAMRDEEYEVTPATGDIYTPAIPAAFDEDGNEVTAAVDEVVHSSDVERPEALADGQQWRETTPAVMGTRSVPDYQGIDQSKLVPLLVKTIQELEARIAALENA